MSDVVIEPVKEKRGVGRPTEYREEFCERVHEYLKGCNDSYEEYHKTRGNTSDTYERTLNVELPTICGFALFLGFGEPTIYEWVKEHPEFQKSLELIKTWQKKRLLNGGLGNKYNATIGKLILSSDHGMREGQDITSGGEKISVNVVSFKDVETEKA